MITYSHSRLSTFEQCKLKYKFGYIDKVETDIVNTVEAFMGDMVHQTLEKLYKDLKFQKINELNELIVFYNELWKKNWDDNIIIVKKQYSKENYSKMGEKMISDYYNRYSPFNQTKTIALETQDFFNLDENYKIHVRIDRLASPEDGVYEIHDYKTNSNLKKQEDLDNDRQLAVYAMGIKKMYPDAKEIILIWHFLAFDKEIRSKRTDSQLEELRKEILLSIKNIETENEFSPTQSPLCNYCEFQEICPVWKHLYQIEKKTPEEYKDDDGVKLVDKYVELKQEEKEISEKVEEVAEKIKEFGNYMGVRNVFGKQHSVSIWSKNVVKFPRKNDVERTKLIKVLKGLNLYEKFLDLDNWELEKSFDSFNEIEKQVLLKIGKKEKISRLYLKKR